MVDKYNTDWAGNSVEEDEEYVEPIWKVIVGYVGTVICFGIIAGFLYVFAHSLGCVGGQ